jgi:hypothetical protein
MGMSVGKLRLGSEKFDTDGAMTFEEIGKRLGIPKGSAWMAYCSGIQKLRRQAAVRRMRELARGKGR